MRSRRHTARWWGRAALLAATAPAALAAQAPPCTPPPPVPDSVISVRGRPAPWGEVAAFVAANNIVFGAGQTSQVTPCHAPGCGSATMTVLTDTVHTNCLSQGMAGSGARYFLGAIVQPGTKGVNAPLGFRQSNVSDTVYVMVQGNTAMGVFHDTSGAAHTVMFNPGHSGWRFHFNPDGMSGGPAGRWKDSVVAARMRVRKEGGPADPAPGGDELQTSYTYAWMQCIAGCCQLIGAGDGPPDTEDHEHEGHGGHNGPGGPPPGPPPPPPSPPPSRD